MEQQTFMLLVAATATAIFLIQFVLSVILGWADSDVDLTTDPGTEIYAGLSVDWGSIISFKGAVHFAIGFGWYMYLVNRYTATDFLIGVIIGITFVALLYILYKKAYQLKQENHPENMNELVGRECTLYFRTLSQQHWMIQIRINGAIREVEAIATTPDMKAGDRAIVVLSKNGTLYISIIK